MHDGQMTAVLIVMIVMIASVARARYGYGRFGRLGRYRRDDEGVSAQERAENLRLRDEVHVLAANRREDAVMRMDPRVQGRHLDAVAPPFVRADHAEQLPQRHDRRLRCLAVRLQAGVAD